MKQVYVMFSMDHPEDEYHDIIGIFSTLEEVNKCIKENGWEDDYYKIETFQLDIKVSGY